MIEAKEKAFFFFFFFFALSTEVIREQYVEFHESKGQSVLDKQSVPHWLKNV